MNKHGGAGRIWHTQVFGESAYICEAETHAPACDGFPTEAHHIVARELLTEPALWLRANGIALSTPCRELALASDNANLSDFRLVAAVNAVNAAQGSDPAHRRPHFFVREYANV